MYMEMGVYRHQWSMTTHLIQVEIDPLLLMSDAQVKAEIDKLSPEEKAKFDDFSSFAEDWHGETGKYEPMDHVMKHLVKVRYPGIPPDVVSQLVQPEDQPEEGAIDSATIYGKLQ